MSDSNIALMSKLDTLPSSAPTNEMALNYRQEEPDMVKSVNEGIDQTQKWNDEHANQLIRIYNHENEKAQKYPQKLIKLLKQGKTTSEDLQRFRNYWADYYRHANRLREQEDEFSNIYGGDAWATYPFKGDFDKDIKKELEAQGERLSVKAEAMQAGSEMRDELPYEANEIIRGPEGAYERENEIYNDIDDLLVHWEHSYRPRAEAGMKIHVPGQYTPDGKPIFKTYQEAVGPEERRYISDMIDAWYAHKHYDIAGGRVGLYKQTFINKLIDKDKTRVKKSLEDDGKALAEHQLSTRMKELKVQIKRDPSYLVTYIQTYKGFSGNSFALARKEAFDTLERGIQVNELQRDEIEAVLDHPFHAHDSTPENPHLVTARNYWKKDSRRLLKALAKAERDEATEDNDMRDGAMKARAKEILESFDKEDAPMTFQAVQTAQLNFMKEFGIRNPEELPDLMKNLPYEGMHDDQELDQNLTWRHYVLNQQIFPEDIRGFTDPILRKKWHQVVKTGNGLDTAGRQRRDNAIKAEVTARTLESDINKARTPKWISNYEQAVEEYDAVYRSIIENGGSDRDAHKEAMKAVRDGLWKESSPGVYQWDTRAESEFDVQPAAEINNMVLAISKDRNLVNSTQPWIGEEPHLIEAGRYFEMSRKGRQVDIPGYYRSIAKQIGIHPERLMLNRLEQTGRIKEGQIEIPEEKFLDPGHQRLLLRPRAATTYRVALENENVKQLIDMVASPVADAHGGYSAIADENGNYVNIEEVVGKPLNEITHSDVLSLIQEGYQNIGMFDLTPRGYMQILADNGINLNAPWNEDTQDAFFIHKLRSTAQRNQRFSTLYNYNRLVNLPLEDIEEFKEITGSDLPRWNQLDTLSAEAAKLLIELLLSEPEQVN